MLCPFRLLIPDFFLNLLISDSDILAMELVFSTLNLEAIIFVFLTTNAVLDHVIETRELTRFFDSRCAVFRLNLKVPKGSIFGLLGPNGAGKTTVIKMLTGRIRPSSGTGRIFGADPWKERSVVFKRMGYLPERPILYEDKDAISFLTFMGRLFGMGRREAKEDARQSLDMVGLGKFESHIIGQMSAGQKQRLGIANAIMGKPDLLLLDEPTANLDPAGRVYIAQLIQDLGNAGHTILISSHILPEIQRMTSHVGIMSEGRLLISGDVAALTKDVFDNEYDIVVSHPDDLFSAMQERGYDVKLNHHIVSVTVHPKRVSSIWDDIPNLIHEKGWQLRAFSPARDPLEKVFMQLVSQEQAIMQEEIV